MKGNFSAAAMAGSPQLIATGWALLAAMTATEVFTTATPPQARGFYRTLGGRIAALGPVDGIGDLPRLSLCINKVWQALEFGEATLAMDGDAILIRHRHMPVTLADDPEEYWRFAAQSLLEGAYDSWFRAMGSQAPLETRVVSMTDAVIELRHGR